MTSSGGLGRDIDPITVADPNAREAVLHRQAGAVMAPVDNLFPEANRAIRGIQTHTQDAADSRARIFHAEGRTENN
jgi:hypothetical protein